MYATVKARNTRHIYVLPVVGVDVEHLRLRYDADRIITVKAVVSISNCSSLSWFGVPRNTTVGATLESRRMWSMAVRLSRRPLSDHTRA